MKTLVCNSDNFKTTWDITTRNFIPMPLEMKNFLGEIVAICKKYNLSISHEDGQGNFIVEEYNTSNIKWLMNASKFYNFDSFDF